MKRAKRQKRKEAQQMSKYMRFTPEILKKLREDFEQSLKLSSISDGKFNFTKTFDAPTEKARLYFTATAWTKTLILVKNFDKEVAWHGLCERVEGEENAFRVYDIIVYPQEVTGATVNTDQVAYQTWLMGLEDEVFSNVRFQGHSHVNMGVSPSVTDINNQGKIIEQLEGDMFYVFMIINKSLTHYVSIYDSAKNIVYENGDVSVMLDGAGVDLDEFMKNSKSVVKEKTYTTPYYQTPYDRSTPYDNRKIEEFDKSWKQPGKKKKKVINADETSGSDAYDDDDNPYSAFGYA